MRVRKAVFPVGGLGTRFLPATKSMPKEMLPIVDKPAIQHAVEEAVAADIEDVVMITGRGKHAIEDHFDHSLELEGILAGRGQLEQLAKVRHVASLCRIAYTRQKQPLGLGHALLSARHLLRDENFAVFLADDVIVSPIPAIRQLLEVHEQLGCSVIAVQRVPADRVSSYGMILPKSSRGRVHEVADLVEKPTPRRAPSDLAVVGRYVLTSSIFRHLAVTAPGARGLIQLTDGLRRLVAEEKLVAVEIEGRRYDAGTPLGYLEATVETALERADIGPELARWLEAKLASEAAQWREGPAATGDDDLGQAEN
jgi:UTP--glucose-1-phosphate uridylyltransferase